MPEFAGPLSTLYLSYLLLVEHYPMLSDLSEALLKNNVSKNNASIFAEQPKNAYNKIK